MPYGAGLITGAKVFVEFPCKTSTIAKNQYYFIELPHVLTVTANQVIKGVASASVTVTNIADTLFFRRNKLVANRANGTSYHQNELREIWDFLLSTKNSLSLLNQQRAMLAKRWHDSITYNGKRDSAAEKELLNTVWEPVLEEFRRVFIFMKGRDGLWYWRFAGFMSRISDSWDAASGRATMTIQCTSIARIAQLSLIVIQNSLANSRRASNQALSRAFSIWATSLAERSSRGVIRKTVDAVNGYYRNTDVGNPLTLFGAGNGVAIWQDPWGAGPSNQEPIGGVPMLYDPSKSPVKTTNEDSVSPDLSKFNIRSVPTVHYSQIPNNDPGIMGFFLRQLGDVWQFEYSTVEIIQERIRATTFFDVYYSARGDLVFQPPQWDNLPRPVARGGVDWEGQNDHGENYIVRDKSLLSFNVDSDEKSVVTKVYAPGGWDIVGAINAEISTGVWPMPASSENAQWEQRYGWRLHQTQTMNRIANKGILDRFAKVVGTVLNARSRTASFRFAQRPDLQIGRNLYFPERDLLCYATSIEDTVDMERGEHFTTVKTEYAHYTDQKLGNPWQDVVHRASSKRISAQAQDVVRNKRTAYMALADKANLSKISGAANQPIERTRMRNWLKSEAGFQYVLDKYNDAIVTGETRTFNQFAADSLNSTQFGSSLETLLNAPNNQPTKDDTIVSDGDMNTMIHGTALLDPNAPSGSIDNKSVGRSLNPVQQRLANERVQQMNSRINNQ